MPWKMLIQLIHTVSYAIDMPVKSSEMQLVVSPAMQFKRAVAELNMHCFMCDGAANAS